MHISAFKFLLKDKKIEMVSFTFSHVTQTSGWLPPADQWDSGGGLNLPYGWEAAQDHEGKVYYVK